MFEEIKEELMNIYKENKFINMSKYNEITKELSLEERNILYDLFNSYFRNDLQDKTIHKKISFGKEEPRKYVMKKLKEMGFNPIETNSKELSEHILCIDEEREFRIKVCSKKKSTNKFQIGRKFEELNDDNIYFVLVGFEKNDNINYYVYESKEVSKLITENHILYHSTFKRDGNVKKNNDMRELKVDKYHLDNWNILTK